jgi:hypothetical protein
MKLLAVLASDCVECILFDADAVPLTEPLRFLRADPWYRSLGVRLFRDVVPVGSFTPLDLFEYLGLDRARFGRLLGGQETDSSCVMLDKRVGT